MKKITLFLVASMLFSGCASQPPAADHTVKPASGSKFSKLGLGMTIIQVGDLIGPSKDCRQTGSAFNPLAGFRALGGAVISECVYKKEGVLGYAYKGGALVLSQITVDTTQDAYSGAHLASSASPTVLASSSPSPAATASQVSTKTTSTHQSRKHSVKQQPAKKAEGAATVSSKRKVKYVNGWPILSRPGMQGE